MSDDSSSLGDMIIAGMIMWALILSIPVAVAGDLGFLALMKIGVLNNAPKLLYILAWFVPALLYGFYVKKLISKYLTQDSFGIGLLMYAQGFLLLGIIALNTDGGVIISKLIISGLNYFFGGGWLTDYGLMFGISGVLFLLGFKVARNYPIVKKRVRKRYI